MFVECPICQKKVEAKPTKTGKSLHYYCPWHVEGKLNVKALREAIASGKLVLSEGSVLQLKLEEGSNGAKNDLSKVQGDILDSVRGETLARVRGEASRSGQAEG